MQFIDLAKNRYSCRSFSSKAVENEKLELVLEAGRLSPTARNLQPVRVMVVKSSESLAKIRSATRMAYNAPVVLMVSYEMDRCYSTLEPYKDDFTSGIMDASIVATSMMMQASDLGLATLWARGFNADHVAQAMGLPEGMKLACLIDVGYADEKEGGPSPRHADRIPMDAFVKTL